ncbi:unnamed protein product [Laminaria digitata]
MVERLHAGKRKVGQSSERPNKPFGGAGTVGGAGAVGSPADAGAVPASAGGARMRGPAGGLGAGAPAASNIGAGAGAGVGRPNNAAVRNGGARVSNAPPPAAAATAAGGPSPPKRAAHGVPTTVGNRADRRGAGGGKPPASVATGAADPPAGAAAGGTAAAHFPAGVFPPLPPARRAPAPIATGRGAVDPSRALPPTVAAASATPTAGPLAGGATTGNAPATFAPANTAVGVNRVGAGGTASCAGPPQTQTPAGQGSASHGGGGGRGGVGGALGTIAENPTVCSSSGSRSSGQPDPHLEEMLRSVGYLKLLQRFVEQEIDLRALALMKDEDFEKLKVAKGPQLKIQHACKTKLEELGISVVSLGGKGNKRKGEDDDDDDKGDNEGKCIVCWHNEVQITFVPCGHQSCCIPCGKALAGSLCPCCRAPVQQSVRFFA